MLPSDDFLIVSHKMKAVALSTLLVASASLVSGQSAAYGMSSVQGSMYFMKLKVEKLAQCGGNGWTGATSCVSGYACTKVNDWYSQCLPGAATTTAQQPTTPSVPTTTATNPQPTSGGTDLPYGTLVQRCTVPNTIAITFDDGPYTWTSALIDSLNRANVTATFFVVGTMYGCIYNYADVIQK